MTKHNLLKGIAILGLAGAVALTALAQQRGPTTSPDAAPWQNSFPVDKTQLVSRGKSKYFFLEPGRRASYAHGTATLVITVLNETKMVDGVETRVIEENESDKGKPVEISRNYFALDKQTGDVYYFGEDVDIYKDGKVDSHDGAWLSGVKGAHFAMMLPGTPKVGQRYFEELAPGVAMDRSEIASVTEKLKVPAGSYEQVVKTNDSSAIEAGGGNKWYAPEIGMVKDDEFDLVKIEMP